MFLFSHLCLFFGLSLKKKKRNIFVFYRHEFEDKLIAVYSGEHVYSLFQRFGCILSFSLQFFLFI